MVEQVFGNVSKRRCTNVSLVSANTTRAWRRLAFAGALLIAGACETALPKDENIKVSPWDTFDDAKAAFDKIELNETGAKELRKLGFDPYQTANTNILSYLDVTHKFTVAGRLELSELEQAVQDCIAARTSCIGYEFIPQHLRSKRTGNAFLDVFGFRRHTIRSGWQFNALVLLNEDVVVYKLWRGTPVIHEVKKETNPLGPLQELGDVLRGEIGP
jgi:hypothetical protein